MGKGGRGKNTSFEGPRKSRPENNNIATEKGGLLISDATYLRERKKKAPEERKCGAFEEPEKGTHCIYFAGNNFTSERESF